MSCEVATTKDSFHKADKPEKSKKSDEVIKLSSGFHKKKDDIHDDHDCINAIPAIIEKYFRANSNQPEDKFCKEKPDEDGVEYVIYLSIWV